MKQTVSIFAPDINIASKSSAIQLWLNRKNQFFSSVLEEGVSNRQVLLLGHASFVFSWPAGAAAAYSVRIAPL